jgi:FKBP-type peptidyl-prolyl cis-trans isomerase
LEAEKKKEAEQNREPEYEYEDYPAEQSTCPASRLDTRIQFQPQDCSRKAREGDKLRMHYVGKLLDGTKVSQWLHQMTNITYNTP